MVNPFPRSALERSRPARPGGRPVSESPPALPLAPSLALAVADVNWFSTEHLFRALESPRVRTVLLRCQDYRNAWHERYASWRRFRHLEPVGPRHWLQQLVLPPGWMKRFPTLGMRPLERAIRRWHQAQAPGAPLGLVITYPYYLYLRDRLRPDCLVYLNLDDYAQYWPRCASEVRALEIAAVAQADLTVCVSLARCEALRAAVPEAAQRIRHLPHGAPALAITPAPLHRPDPRPPDLPASPGPILGYIGSLEDRIDWPLLDRLAARFPHASLVLIGRLPRRARSDDCRRCLARPNVYAIGWRSQQQMRAYNAAFDVCLIPYRPDHPFNQACCPTKIMDYMATGRPIVSTDLPECRLHSSRMVVAPDGDRFLDAVATILDSGSDDGLAHTRHAYALDHTCESTASRLLDWITALPPRPA